MTKAGNDSPFESAAERTPRRVGLLIALSIVVTLAFCTICGAVLLEIRQADFDRAKRTGDNIVGTIEADIARNIDLYDLSLQAVVEGLRLPWIYSIGREARDLVLFDRAATAKHLGSIYVLDAVGNVVMDSRSTVLPMENFSDRDFFRYHRPARETGLYISAPFRDNDGARVIAITRRLSKPDGSFSGIVMGTLRLAYFEEMFKKITLGPNGIMTLSRDDGVIIMRWPHSEHFVGRTVSGGTLFKLWPTLRSGSFESRSVTDGIERLYTFTQIGDFPLLFAVGQSTVDIYAGWENEATKIGLLILILCGVTAMLAALLSKELRHRAVAEQRLAVLATTDALTGLSNRRHFNNVIVREWQRATREQKALSVLMIDADDFKAFNDTHGHQAGDEVLEALGRCVSRFVRRPGDLGARYGGEEFTVLLTGTDLDGATAVAEQIRGAVQRLRHGTHDRARDISTVSIGVASIVPKPGQHYRELINAADLALYEAKRAGRNRTVAAPPYRASPSLAPESERKSRVA